MENKVIRCDGVLGVNCYSTDYENFKLIEGNRPIDLCHVQEIINYILSGNEMLPMIMINEKGEIIDGQHRFSAWKASGKPIRYYIQEGAGFNEMLLMNSEANTWKLEDYLSSGVSRQLPMYVTLNNMIKKYKLNISDLIVVMDELSKEQLGQSGRLKLFKQGKLNIENELEIINFLHDLYLFKENENFRSQAFVRAFLKLYVSDFYDSEYIRERAKNAPKEIALMEKGDLEQCCGQLVDFYTSKVRNVIISYNDGNYYKVGNQGRRRFA
jgi:hypothetical protein